MAVHWRRDRQFRVRQFHVLSFNMHSEKALLESTTDYSFFPLIFSTSEYHNQPMLKLIVPKMKAESFYFLPLSKIQSCVPNTWIHSPEQHSLVSHLNFEQISLLKKKEKLEIISGHNCQIPYIPRPIPMYRLIWPFKFTHEKMSIQVSTTDTSSSKKEVFNRTCHLYESELLFFSMDEIEGSYSPVYGAYESWMNFSNFFGK